MTLSFRMMGNKEVCRVRRGSDRALRACRVPDDGAGLSAGLAAAMRALRLRRLWGSLLRV